MDEINTKQRLILEQGERYNIAKAFIENEAISLAKLCFGSSAISASGLFETPLVLCYERGFNDALMTMGERMAKLFNAGFNGIDELDTCLNWSIKKGRMSVEKK